MTLVYCQSNRQQESNMSMKSDKEWKEELSPEAYHVLREKGTEHAFTGKFNVHKENGTYHCGGCKAPLFSSAHKYDSGSGWPSFFDLTEQSTVKTKKDNSFGMSRIEVYCGNCNGHLGHVFEDGPKPTGKRYCINSAALSFKKASK